MRYAIFALILPLPLLGQSAPSASSQSNVMIVSVAHDDSVATGGISSSGFLHAGKANVNPVAWLTPAGDWLEIECAEMPDGQPSEACPSFDRNYLSKPHTYTVVSADGKGSPVSVPRMSLDGECFGIRGRGSFPAGAIRNAAVGAESGDLFIDGPAARRLPESEAPTVRAALARRMGKKLDSTKELRVYALTLEGHNLVVIQRALQDYADKPEYRPPNSPPQLDFIFAIGEMVNGNFRLLHWKENTSDDNEQILDLIHLKNGRDFLVNTASDPETYSFRVYGIRDGKLAVVFEGGGGGC
jgi:hypothetical protein